MSEEFRADLHCHSNCSDGTDSPLELLRKAKEAGLKGLSITDHDTTAAYTKELFSQAKELGIELLQGIEISSEFQGITVHVLGYGYSLKSAPLQAFLVEMQAKRTTRNQGILAKLREKKISITEEELLEFAQKDVKNKIVGRPHIAEVLLLKGYVKTKQEAFERFLKEGASCYVSGFKYTPGDVIEALHLANGKAVLAHPHFFKGGSFLKNLLLFPFDGVECYYANLSKDQERRWLDLAKEKGWIATGGSDYHGSFKPHISLGASYVDRKTFDALYANPH